MGAGMWLAAAAATFWLAWALMPGVGVTDAREILALVGSQRSMVLASVIVQLVSTVLYIPALLGITAKFARDRALRWGVALLLVGALGSAADAVLHLLAYAMTAPGLEPHSQVPVMTFMQGPGLWLLAPLILSFFLGGAWLSVALGRRGIGSRVDPWLHALAVLVATAGGATAAGGFLPPRLVGLATLGVVSLAQIRAGLATRQVATVQPA